MKKRIMSAGLAAIMATSALSISAFAADLKGDNSLSAAGSVNLPTLKVSVPTSAGFVVNPYKLKVKVAGSANGNAAEVIPTYGSGKSAWTVINNSSDIALTAYMYTTYKAAKTVVVNPETNATDKRNLTLNLYVGAQEAENKIDLLEVAPTAWTVTTEGVTTPATGVKSFALAKKVDGSTANQKDITLTGSVVDGEEWLSSDTVSLTMAFKFDFVKNTTYQVTFTDARTDSTGIPAAFEIVKDDKIAKPEDPTVEGKGFTFKEWQSEGSAYDFDTPVTAATTLTAAWDKEAYTITFVADAESVATIATGATATIAKNSETAPTAPTITAKDDYTTTIAKYVYEGNNYTTLSALMDVLNANRNNVNVTVVATAE